MLCFSEIIFDSLLYFRFISSLHRPQILLIVIIYILSVGDKNMKLKENIP